MNSRFVFKKKKKKKDHNLASSYIQVKVSFFFFLVKIYASTMIFNHLYEIKFSSVSITRQFINLMDQISLNLISIK